MPISDRLDEIEARCDAATEGSWKIETHYGMSQSRRRQIVVPGWMTPIAVLGQENPYGDPDAEFIAHARTDVPALVAALRAVLDLCDKALAVKVSGSTEGDAAMAAFASAAHRAIAAALGEGS